MYTYQAWAEQNLEIFGRHDAEYKIQCLNPAHDDAHPSAYFNVDKGSWYCHSCGARGSIASDPELNSVELKINSQRSRIAKLLSPEEESVSFSMESTLNRYKLPHPYWASRGFNEETVELFQLGYDAISDAVTIPIRNLEGALIGVTRRFVGPEHFGPRYKYPKGFKASQNLYASWLYDEYDMSTVSIHEGAIDTMRMWQLGIPAIAVYGSSISPEHVQILLRMGVKKVVYFGDSDNAGQRAKERAKGFWVRPDDTYTYKKETDLSKHFLFYHITNYHNKKDAGEMTDREIVSSWKSIEPYGFHGDTRRKKVYINPRLRLKTK